MKAIPKTLEEWTYQAIVDLLEEGYQETTEFDWKEVLTVQGDEKAKKPHRLMLCKVSCSFANSFGGFIVFGVEDGKSNKKGKDRIVGLADTGDLPKDFNDKIKNCERSIDYHVGLPPIAIPGSDRVLLVVHIPKSTKGLHGFKHDGIVHFYKREQGASEPMTHREIVEQISLSEERRSKMNLLCKELESNVRKIEWMISIIEESDKKKWPTMNVSTTRLEALLIDLAPLLLDDQPLLVKLDGIKEVLSMVANMTLVFQSDASAGIKPLPKLIDRYLAWIKPIPEKLNTHVAEAVAATRNRYGITS